VTSRGTVLADVRCPATRHAPPGGRLPADHRYSPGRPRRRPVSAASSAPADGHWARRAALGLPAARRDAQSASERPACRAALKTYRKFAHTGRQPAPLSSGPEWHATQGVPNVGVVFAT
jgi:hypothetical protein